MFLYRRSNFCDLGGIFLSLHYLLLFLKSLLALKPLNFSAEALDFPFYLFGISP